MPRSSAQQKSLTKYDKFGIGASMIGLLADFIALGTIGYSLVNNGDVENHPNVTVLFWMGILLIVPLIYVWGFILWLANSKKGKPIMSVILTGISVMPFYAMWGAFILAEEFRSLRFNYDGAYYIVTGESRLIGSLVAIAIQLGLGLVLFGVLLLWNKFSGTTPEKKQEILKGQNRPTKRAATVLKVKSKTTMKEKTSPS